MTIAEHIEKAQNLTNQLTVHLAEAYRLSVSVDRPEGRTVADNALTAYLSEKLEEVRLLGSKIFNL